MSRFFSLHDPGEKKYIFNSFLIFVLLVEIIILAVTIIWQIDEGWFGGEVRVIPFPWKEYLLMAALAPVLMIFLFGIIIRGFDLLNAPAPNGPGNSEKFWQRLNHKCSLISYLFGVAFLFAFIYGMLYPEKVLTYFKALYSVLGQWGTYVVVGIVALSMLYFPISLLLRYRLAKKAMEYQYQLALVERHGVLFDRESGQLIAPPTQAPNQAKPESLDQEPAQPLLELDHTDSP